MYVGVAARGSVGGSRRVHPERPSASLRALLGRTRRRADRSAPFLEGLEFEPGWEARGARRGGFYVYDEPPAERPMPGGGTVHHVAWGSRMGDQDKWRERVARAGAHPTPVIDRFYFRSVYFREPSGVLFEIATIGPGFATDEPQESLGQKLALPPAYEHLREQIERTVTPLPPTR